MSSRITRPAPEAHTHVVAPAQRVVPPDADLVAAVSEGVRAAKAGA